MSKSKSLFFFAASLVVIFLVGESCVSHDFPSYTCPDDDVSYTAEVRNIIDTKCTISPCHGTDPDLPNWDELVTLQEHAEEVKRRVVDRIMPPANTPGELLSQEQINTIACWIDGGAQNN
jgi:uncharacterized membrane protein